MSKIARPRMAAICALLVALGTFVWPSAASANVFCWECVKKVKAIQIPDGSWVFIILDDCKGKDTPGVSYDDCYVNPDGSCHLTGAPCTIALV